MTTARAASAAAAVGLAAVFGGAAWFAIPRPSGPGRFAVRAADAPASAVGSYGWQDRATGADRVAEAARASAATIEIAVVDTGADVSAPDLTVRRPAAYDMQTHSSTVTDANGHGTFVASIATGSLGGAARLLIIKAANAGGSMSAASEAGAIRYAVDHGARIVNLSLSGVTTSAVERSAIRYAIGRGVLLVAAAGNDFDRGNPVEYPAALLQPVGSNGRGGVGLAVAASTQAGTHAAFSSAGSWISLAAPGENVFGAVSGSSSTSSYPRATVPGLSGLYGFASGTSFAAPQVAAAAALVWGARPSLTPRQVAQILKDTASGHGVWTPELGFGVIDVAAAVARASQLG
jgi:subtilisin family serine protease